MLHASFYCFTAIDEPEALAEKIRRAAVDITGTILIAPEGVNAAVAGEPGDLAAFLRWFHSDPRFVTTPVKQTACVTQPYAKLKVTVTRELVDIGRPSVNAAGHQPSALSPAQWRDMLIEGNTLVLDNRNNFEFQLGRFKGAINPNVSRYRDFADFVESNLPTWREQGKAIAMYCTGGIRCDKTSAWLEQHGVKSMTLEGGILNYLQTFPGDSLFEGHCFVFDNRIALDNQLNEANVEPVDVFAGLDDADWRIARAERLKTAIPKSTAVVRSDDPKVLLPFLVSRFGHIAQEEWEARISRGLVLDAYDLPLGVESILHEGQRVTYFRRVPCEQPIPFEAQILFEDELIIIADKPHFLPVVPSGKYLQETLLYRLRANAGQTELSPAHRLDRDTAGLVLLVKQAEHRAAYQRLFALGQIEKRYQAVSQLESTPKISYPQWEAGQTWTVSNRLERSPMHFMQARVVEGEANARTDIKLTQVVQLESGKCGHFDLQPYTGQRHQLRVHLMLLGAPILYDEIYPTLTPEPKSRSELRERYKRPLQLLAKSLAFRDPVTGQQRNFESSQTLAAIKQLA